VGVVAAQLLPSRQLKPLKQQSYCCSSGRQRWWRLTPSMLKQSYKQL
jgi:hypothetical protein